MPDTRIYFYIIYFFHFTLLEFLRFYKRCDLNLQKKSSHSNFFSSRIVDIFFISLYRSIGGRSFFFFFVFWKSSFSRSRGRPHPLLFKFTSCRFKLVLDGGTINVLWGGWLRGEGRSWWRRGCARFPWRSVGGHRSTIWLGQV